MNEPAKLGDTWHWREYPVLREAARICDSQAFAMAELREIVEATGITRDEVLLALKALDDAGLIEVRWTMGGPNARVQRISSAARVHVGLWPSPETAFDRIVSALENIANHTGGQDHENARNAASALKELGQQFGNDIGAAALGESDQ